MIRTLLTNAALFAIALAVRPDRKPRKPRTPVTHVSPAAFTPAAPVEVKEPKPLLAEDIKGAVPSVDAIEKAARSYEQARTDYNAANRIKNKAAKVLAETPDGTYGLVTVERFASSRQTADLDAIRAIFTEHGLGDVPMKTNAASITLTFAEANAPAHEQLLAA